MSSAAGPLISTTGLVLDVDMSNTKKSWKGQPTINYVPNADTMTGWNNYSNTANGTPAQFMTDFGTTGYRMDWVGSWNGVHRTITVPAIGIYTFSAWIKWIGGSANVTGGAVYISGWGGGDSSSATNRTLPDQWQRISITLNCTTTSMTFFLICWGGTNNADNSSWQVTMPQVEAGSAVTPFVLGTRSNTQAIVDLTNNNTITATSLTYNSDNTFSFNGTDNYIDVIGLGFTSGMSAYTIMHWSRRDVESRMPICSRAGPVFYHYGDNSWKYTHGGVGGEYYYPHAVSIPVGTYGFYCIVYNGANVSIYRNGVFEGSQATTGTADWSNGMKIGMYTGSGYYYQGKINSVSFYNRALSAGEVYNNFNAARSRYGL